MRHLKEEESEKKNENEHREKILRFGNDVKSAVRFCHTMNKNKKRKKKSSRLHNTRLSIDGIAPQMKRRIFNFVPIHFYGLIDQRLAI